MADVPKMKLNVGLGLMDLIAAQWLDRMTLPADVWGNPTPFGTFRPVSVVVDGHPSSYISHSCSRKESREGENGTYAFPIVADWSGSETPSQTATSS
jgi:hypothetical protein